MKACQSVIFLQLLVISIMGKRKCYYRNCGHQQGVSRCSLYGFPQQLDIAAHWLRNAGIDHLLTPKRLKPLRHYLCSCHFPQGKHAGPSEFVDEYDVSTLPLIYCNRVCTFPHVSHGIFCQSPAEDQELKSPAPKTWRSNDCRTRLTPRRNVAVEGLLALVSTLCPVHQ